MVGLELLNNFTEMHHYLQNWSLSFTSVSKEDSFLDMLFLKSVFLFSVLSSVAFFVLVAPLSAMPFSSLSFAALTSQNTIPFSHTIRHLSPPTSQILAQFSHFLSTVNNIKGTINKNHFLSHIHFSTEKPQNSCLISIQLVLFATHCFSWSTTALSLKPGVNLGSGTLKCHYSKIFQPLLPSFLGRPYTISKTSIKGNSEGKNLSPSSFTS